MKKDITVIHNRHKVELPLVPETATVGSCAIEAMSATGTNGPGLGIFIVLNSVITVSPHHPVASGDVIQIKYREHGSY